MQTQRKYSAKWERVGPADKLSGACTGHRLRTPLGWIFSDAEDIGLLFIPDPENLWILEDENTA